MLQVLQYFTGTSMAAMSEVAGLIMTQSLVGGPIAMGSSAGSGGGMGCKFRGRILIHLISTPDLRQRSGRTDANLPPG